MVDDIVRATYKHCEDFGFPREESERAALTSTARYILTDLQISTHSEIKEKYLPHLITLVLCEYFLLTGLSPTSEKETIAISLGDAAITYNPNQKEEYFSELKGKRKEVRNHVVASLRQVKW